MSNYIHYFDWTQLLIHALIRMCDLKTWNMYDIDGLSETATYRNNHRTKDIANGVVGVLLNLTSLQNLIIISTFPWQLSFV